MTPQEISQLPYRPCVGVMLINADGKVFVGQRIDSNVAAWQMPQGGIDSGESPDDAALRELQEETGVTPDQIKILGKTTDWVTYDLPADLVPKIWKGRFRGQKQLWFLMQFNGTDDQITIDKKHAEFSEWTWLHPEALVENIVTFKRDVYRQVVAELGPLIASAL